MQSTNDNDLLTRSQALKEIGIPDPTFTMHVRNLGIKPVKRVGRNSFYSKTDIEQIQTLYADGKHTRKPYKPREKRNKQSGSEESNNTTQTAQADNIAASSISIAQVVNSEDGTITLGSESSTLIFSLSAPNTSPSCIEGINISDSDLDIEVIGCLSTTLNANEKEIGFNLSAAIISCSSSSFIGTGNQSASEPVVNQSESIAIASESTAEDTNLYSLSAASSLGGISFEGNEQSVPMDSKVIGDSAISGISNSDTTDSFAQIGGSAIENTIQGYSAADIMDSDIPDSNAQGTSNSNEQDGEEISEVIGNDSDNLAQDSAQTKSVAEANGDTYNQQANKEESTNFFQVDFHNCINKYGIKDCAQKVFEPVVGNEQSTCWIDEDSRTLRAFFEVSASKGKLAGRIQFDDDSYADIAVVQNPNVHSMKPYRADYYINEPATGGAALVAFFKIRSLLNKPSCRQNLKQDTTPKVKTANQYEDYISEQQAEEIKAQLNALSYAEFASLIGLQRARESGWICPVCGSGSGEHGTGVTFKSYGDGSIYGQCWNGGCHFSGDYIRLASLKLGISDKGKSYFTLLKELASRMNMHIDNLTQIISRPARQDNSQDANRRKEPNFYGWTHDFAQKEFAKAREQVTWYLNKQGNEHKPVSIRGLTRPTLEYFGFGFLREYYPKPKDKQNWRLVNRLIIPIDSDPNGISHISRLLPDKNDDRLYEEYQLKPAKYRVGNLLPFNVTRINRNDPIIFLTEGEIDTASCWQASEGKFNFVALGTDNISSSAADIFRKMPPKQFVVLMDNDQAGRDAAPKVAEKLKVLGHKAVVKFLPAKEGCEKKFDANDWLIECSAYLSNRLNCIYEEAKEEFTKMDNATKEENAQIQQASDKQPANGVASSEPVATNELQISNATLSRLFEGDLTDEDFSKRLKLYYGKYIRLLDGQEWMVYSRTKNVWAIGNRENSTITPYVRDLSLLLQKHSKKFGGEKIAHAFKSISKREKAIAGLKYFHDIRITFDDLYRHKNLVCVKNGVIDLQDGRLMQADPSLLITQQVNAVYNPNVDCSEIEKFISGIMPNEETAAGLRCWLGYSLTGESNMKRFACWTGRGSNGKSLLGNLLSCLFADYATSINRKALIETKTMTDANAATPALAGIIGKRLVLSEEVPENAVLDSALLKTLTGNNDTVFRPIWHAPIVDKIHPYTINIISNFLPKLSDVGDGAMTERLIDFPFKVKFIAGDKPLGYNEKRADTMLEGKLKTARNQSALLTILVNAARDWYKTGKLIISPEMQAANEEHLADSDTIGNFVIDFFSERTSDQYSIKQKDFVEALTTRHPRLLTKFQTKKKLRETISKNPLIQAGKDNHNNLVFTFLPNGNERD